jgi:hypothetical protein
MTEVLAKILRGDAPELERVSPGTSSSLVAIVSKAMALVASDRYESADALATDVETVLDGRTPNAERASLVRRLGRIYMSRDRGLRQMRVVDLDFWIASGWMFGLALGARWAAHVLRFVWPLCALALVFAVPPTLRWLRVRRESSP